MTERTIGDIAAARPAAVRVFEHYGIDYCCGGQRSLADACAERGVSAEEVLAAVETNDRSDAPERDWTTATLGRLIGHIVHRHHGYLYAELPTLRDRLAKVIAAHGDRHSETLGPLEATFSALNDELGLHLRKEEEILFPAIGELEAAETARRAPVLPPFGTVRNPIRMMENEHESAGRALRAMRELTGNYAVPPDACSTWRALFAGLEELEKDLHAHIHLENNVLFPRAAELEKRMASDAKLK
jgi:regulator of cell morphogenesis and NO signaling